MANRRIEKEVRRLAHHQSNIVKVTRFVFEEQVKFKKQKTGWFSSTEVADGIEKVLVEVHYEVPGEMGNNSYISKCRGYHESFLNSWNESIWQAEKFAEQIEHINLYK